MPRVSFDERDFEIMRKVAREEVSNEIDKRLSSSGAPCRGDAWTEKDDDCLKADFISFISNAAVVRGRSINSIIARLRKFELSRSLI
jgi:hypothetical protein